MSVSKCKGCGAPIIWIKTAAGQNMPLDERTYTLYLLEPDGEQASSPRAKQVQVHASHFSTCVEADAFRRKRR